MDMWNKLDPELVEPLRGALEAMGGGTDLGDLAGARAMMDGMIATIKEQAPPIEGVERKDLATPGRDGDPSVALRLYRPDGATGALPVLLWMHPGGFALGSIELDDLMVAQMAKDVRCAIVSVDYRLAPEHPYPAALHDCYAALEHVASNAESLGLRRDRIAVGGSSAGGGLAAALALMARDRGEIDIAFQLLIYPAINDRNVAPADDEHPDTLFWTRDNNILAWRMYLGDLADDDANLVYAAPYRATELRGLPPAYIAVGELDLFIDDNIEYANRLKEAGVKTELRVYPGAFHAFDAFAPMSAVAQQFVTHRNAALAAALA